MRSGNALSVIFLKSQLTSTKFQLCKVIRASKCLSQHTHVQGEISEKTGVFEISVVS